MSDRLWSHGQLIPGRCGSLHNHSDGEVRGCVLDRGHSGQHISADRVRWERGNYQQIVRLGLGARTPTYTELVNAYRSVSEKPNLGLGVKTEAVQ